MVDIVGVVVMYVWCVCIGYELYSVMGFVGMFVGVYARVCGWSMVVD
jgi:hypothetical protein